MDYWIFWEFHAKNVLISLFIFGVVTMDIVYPSIKYHFKEKYQLTWKNVIYLFASLFQCRNERIFLYVYSWFTTTVSIYGSSLYWCIVKAPNDKIKNNLVNDPTVYVVSACFIPIFIIPLLFLINVIFVQLGFNCKVKCIGNKCNCNINSCNKVNKQQVNYCTGIGIIGGIIVSIPVICILGNKFGPGSTTLHLWPVFTVIIFWDFWYNA